MRARLAGGLRQFDREFERLARGTSRIRSDQPRWDAVQLLREKAEQLQERVDVTAAA